MGYLNRFLGGLTPIARVFIGFVPFFGVYLYIVLLSTNQEMAGDEGRYIWFAENLLNGYYSPSGNNLNLWNGPGYPILLMPFLYLGLPKIYITALNAFFLYLSLPLFYLTISKYTSVKNAILASLCLGLWFPGYNLLGMVMTEYFTFFLVALSVFLIVNIERKYARLWLGLVLGFLMLTKVIFAYVLLTGLVLNLIHYFLINKKLSKPFLISIIFAFFLTFPYQYYTHHLTGKWFYWANSGGMSLYWMSSLDPQEFGDWNSVELDAYCWDGSPICNEAYFDKNHGKFMAEILALPPLKRDSAFKSVAIKNIKSQPVKFGINVWANITRMFFNYPESYMFPRLSTLFRLGPGSLLFSFMLVTVGLGLWHFRSVPFEIKIVFLFSIIYLGGSSLLSAYPRFLNVILPAVILFVAYILDRFLLLRN
jgi:hypothetical protein